MLSGDWHEPVVYLDLYTLNGYMLRSLVRVYMYILYATIYVATQHGSLISYIYIIISINIILYLVLYIIFIFSLIYICRDIYQLVYWHIWILFSVKEEGDRSPEEHSTGDAGDVSSRCKRVSWDGYMA